MIQYFYILHVFSIIALFASCAASAANPAPDRRKQMLMFSGIFSLLAVLSGFGIAGIGKFGFTLWVWVKIVCWLVLSVLVGVFFRRPDKSGLVLGAATFSVLIALASVYLKF
ncbi:MAG TPA: hypothetical protein PKA63_13045 [Oligoflexia bacterium]|nr:hypothetical protein [Oligoflexia bacterium]HMP49586.1 hypothetical protein [Oligoflexia bacterium]